MKFLANAGRKVFTITLNMRSYAEYVDFLSEHKRPIPANVLDYALKNPDHDCPMFTKEVAEMMAPGCTITVA